VDKLGLWIIELKTAGSSYSNGLNFLFSFAVLPVSKLYSCGPHVSRGNRARSLREDCAVLQRSPKERVDQRARKWWTLLNRMENNWESVISDFMIETVIYYGSLRKNKRTFLLAVTE
jgi:hypothetical protein